MFSASGGCDTRRKLEVAADIAVIVIVVVVSVALAKMYLGGRRATPEVVRVGDRLRLSGVNWDGKRTLVLVMRAGCEFCEKSGPLYRRLAAMERHGEIAARILAVLPDSRASARAFLASEGLSSVDSICDVPLARLGVPGTPMAILVDERGRVSAVWVGLLGNAKGSDLIRSVESQPGGPLP